MQKVLKLLGAIFMIIGLVFVALGTGLVLAAREPVLFVFAAMGMVFFFVGIGMMAALSRRRRLRLWLEENGRTIQADIIGVQYDTRVRLNGRCPLVLQCQARTLPTARSMSLRATVCGLTPRPFWTAGPPCRCWWTPTTTTGTTSAPRASCPNRGNTSSIEGNLHLWIFWETMT